MSCTTAPLTTAPAPFASPLMLADQLLTMAQETDRAGYVELARRMLGLAFDVLDVPARRN